MNILITIWSMIAAVSLTLSLVHLNVWVRRRNSLAHLAFACTSLAVAAFAVCDLFINVSEGPKEFGRALWFLEFSVFFFIVGSVAFIRTYLKAGPVWLAWSIVGLRSVMLLWNLPSPYSANYSFIDHLEQVWFLGESVSVAVGTLSYGRYIGALSEVGLLVFALCATVTVWRRGDRRRAVLASGSLALFMLIAAGQAWLVFHGVMAAPFYVVPAFLLVISAMGLELGNDIIRAAELSTVIQKSAAELRESERRMDLAASAAQLGLWDWDVVRDDIWFSAPARSLFGISPAEAFRLDRFLQTLHPDDSDRVRQLVMDSLAGNGEYVAEFRVMMPDGSVRWIASRGRVDHDIKGVPIRMLGVSLDITQRHLAEERSQAMIEAAPNSLLVVNRGGELMTVNAQTEQVFGYARQELIGRSVDLLIPAQPHFNLSKMRHDDPLRPTMHSTSEDPELYGLRRDGTKIPIEVGLSSVQVGRDRLLMASVVDISERKRIELELARQRNELAHLSRVTMLGELSGSLAHELNQPLASILSNAQAAQRFMAQDEPDLAELRDILEDIVAEDRRAGEIIYRLRALLRKEAVEYKPLDVNELISDSLRLIRSDLINQGVVCSAEYLSVPAMVKGDRIQLQQVLINLIVNACDAMSDIPRPDRRLVFRARAGDKVCLVDIIDRGVGVPADRLESIFDAFYTSKAKGMGLGLAVCRTIMDAHAGRLWASNNTDRGITMHLELPVI
jgi:PAS domain S-box-containing protein